MISKYFVLFILILLLISVVLFISISATYNDKKYNKYGKYIGSGPKTTKGALVSERQKNFMGSTLPDNPDIQAKRAKESQALLRVRIPKNDMPIDEAHNVLDKISSSKSNKESDEDSDEGPDEDPNELYEEIVFDTNKESENAYNIGSSLKIGDIVRVEKLIKPDYFDHKLEKSNSMHLKDIVEAKQAIETKDSDIKHLTDINDSLLKDIKFSLFTIDKLWGQYNTLSSEHDELLSDYFDLQSGYDSLSKDKNDLNDENQKKYQENKDLKIENRELKREINLLRQGINDIHEDAQELISSAKLELKNNIKKIKELKEQNRKNQDLMHAGLQFLLYVGNNNILKDQEIDKLKSALVLYYTTYATAMQQMATELTHTKSNLEDLEDQLRSTQLFVKKQASDINIGEDIQYPTKRYLNSSEQMKSLVMPDFNGNIKIQVVNNRNTYPRENNTLSYIPARQIANKYRKHYNKELTLSLSNLPYGLYFNKNGEVYVN
jgi:cell division protein FtsB